MPRYPRSYIKTQYFHVITQGINKSFIFDDVVDIKYYIKLMFLLAQEQKVNIEAYCIMNNHVHMLLKVEQLKELSKYMHRLNTRYGIYYNKKYNKIGYVFRDRYKAEGIYSEKHLYNCIKYIHNNPVKAGICNRPEEYPYSDYKKRKGDESNEYVFLDVDEDKEEICKKVIKDFLEINKMEKCNLKKDEKHLKQLIIILKDEHSISLRKIAEEIGINREKIRKIYNK